MTFVLVKRLSDGKVLEIPERDLDTTLKRGFELVKEEKQEPLRQIGVICPLCDRNFKNEHGLRIHKQSHP